MNTVIIVLNLLLISYAWVKKVPLVSFGNILTCLAIIFLGALSLFGLVENHNEMNLCFFVSLSGFVTSLLCAYGPDFVGAIKAKQELLN